MNHSTMSKAAVRLHKTRLYPPNNRREPIIYRQGDHDSLCGLYALVNAANLLKGPLHRDQVKDLFLRLVREYEKHRSLSHVLERGMVARDLLRLLTIIEREYRIRYRMPFRKQSNVRLQTAWDCMQEWVGGSGVVLIRTRDHWSVTREMTKHVAFLHDSDGRKHYIRSQLCRSKNKLLPEECIFLERV